MYFVSKGDCAVNIKDRKNQHHTAWGLLTEGDHFGEISLLYKCPRTASIVSRNYNTITRITYDKYRDVSNVFPKYAPLLKKYSFQYNDPNKRFLINAVRRIDYFKLGLSDWSLHDLIYRFRTVSFDEG